MKKKTLAALAVIAGLVMAPLAVAAASADDSVPTDEAAQVETFGGDHFEKKVWVCKYVGAPGVDEVLKDGKNPIEVSVNTLKDFPGTFPWAFPDAQGRSIAVAYSEKGGWAECPEPEGPNPPAPLGGVEKEDRSVCVLPLDGHAIVTTYERKWTQDYIVVDHAWVLGEKVFGDWMPAKGTPATVEDEECDAPPPADPEPVSVTPPAPQWFDPCGADNGYFVTTETEGVIWTAVSLEQPGGRRVTATPAEGFYFPEGATAQWQEVDSGALCPVTPPTTPDVPKTVVPASSTQVLAATGGGDIAPFLPIGAAVTILLGVGSIVARRLIKH